MNFELDGIAVATPLYDRAHMSADTAYGLCGLAQHGAEVMPAISSASVEINRNLLVARFLTSSTKPYLLFVDGDIGGFTVQHVSAMRDLGKPVVAVDYPTKQIELAPLAHVDVAKLERTDAARLISPLTIESNQSVTKPQQVNAAPAGFMLIQRRVFARFVEFGLIDRAILGLGRYARMYFHPRMTDSGWISEDVAFCMDVQEMGFEVWLDPRPHLHHVGTHAFGH